MAGKASESESDDGPTVQERGHPGLDLKEDVPFQRRFWRWQRAGWGVMALIVAAGLLGLFGRGPLADATINDPAGAVRIEYQRFGRFESQSTLRVHVTPAVLVSGRVAVHFPHAYLRAVQFAAVMPEPEAAIADEAGLTYLFRVARSDRPSTLTFAFKFDSFGLIGGDVRIGEQATVRVDHVVYP